MSVTNLPPIPIETFQLYVFTLDLQLRLIPNTIGTASGTWLFRRTFWFMTVVRYTYRDKSTLKFSAIVRTIEAEATIYFLVMVAV